MRQIFAELASGSLPPTPIDDLVNSNCNYRLDVDCVDPEH
jgi:hypothetical protein